MQSIIESIWHNICLQIYHGKCSKTESQSCEKNRNFKTQKKIVSIFFLVFGTVILEYNKILQLYSITLFGTAKKKQKKKIGYILYNSYQTNSMCNCDAGPCLQLIITILSFIATATIAEYFDLLLEAIDEEATHNTKAIVIISVSSLSFILSLIKLCTRRMKVQYNRNHLGNDDLKSFTSYMTAYKAIIVQIVDSTFDIMVAISLFNNLEYGQNQSLLLVLTSFIGFGEEVIELSFEFTFCLFECCAENCIYGINLLVVIEFIGCIMELSFGIYLGTQILNSKSGREFFVGVVVTFSILICCILCACCYFVTDVCKEGIENKRRIKSRKMMEEYERNRSGISMV